MTENTMKCEIQTNFIKSLQKTDELRFLMIVPALLHTALILMLKIITEITTDISSTTIFCHHFNEMSRIEQWFNTKNGIMRITFQIIK